MASQPFLVNPTTIENAITSLLKWRDSQSQTENPKLFPNEDEFLYLYVTLKKIPSNPRINPFKLPLPHAITTPESQTCLIIDDREGSVPTKEEIKQKIQNEGVGVNKVLRLSKLRTDYKPFEAKRKLCGSYDVFLTDKRIVHFLPRLLGKEFFRKRKLPVTVDLGKRNLKEQVARVCRSGLLYLGSGTCCVVKAGRVSMGVKELVENVAAGVEGVKEVVPKGWKGVRSLSLKLEGSLALPVYRAVPDVRLRIEGVKDVEEGEGVVENVGEGKEEVEEEKKGRKKKKGRIHEVRYMDHIEGEVFDEDDFGSDIDDDEDGVGDVKNVEAEELDSENFDEEELDGGDSEDERELDESELVGKKRKKGGKKKKGVVSSELNDEKPAKKKSKVKNEDGIQTRKKKSAEDGAGRKKKKVTFSEDVEESGTKDKKKKKNVVGKSKGEETKVRAKKSKKAMK